MKKILLLTAALLTGGLTLNASAQRFHVSAHVTVPASSIFISGYQSCGTPIYSTRYYHGNRYQTRCLNSHEIRYHRHHLSRLAVAHPYRPQYRPTHRHRPVYRPSVEYRPVHRHPYHRPPVVRSGYYCR